MNDGFFDKFYHKDFPHFEKFKQLLLLECKDDYLQWKNDPNSFLRTISCKHDCGSLSYVVSITPNEFTDLQVKFVDYDNENDNDFMVWYKINNNDIYFSSYDSQWFRIPDFSFPENITYYEITDSNDNSDIENSENNDIDSDDYKNIDSEIEIELYPNDAPLFTLGYKSELLFKIGDLRDDTEIQIRDITLKVESTMSYQRYTLRRENCVIAGFKEDEFSFQLGDCSAYVFIHNGTDIIIVNGGDVCSTVVFKNCFKLKEKIV